MSKKLTIEEFIARATKIYGNKYNYEKSIYIDCKTKLIIICPEHGSFQQTPNDHFVSCGCKQCYSKNRHTNTLTTKEFINRSQKIHNNKYDYSKSVYKNHKAKLIIICPIHGEFLQSPINHLNCCGCKICENESRKLKNKSNIIKFIEKANKIHKEKYDYSKSIYINSHTKIEIICKVHKSFWQSPNDHLIGKGCKKCYKYKIAKMLSLTTNDFIERAKLIHGDLYDYNKSNYTKMINKVIIKCKIHGYFKQIASNHLIGKGCIKCYNERKILSTEEFINRANKVHFNKYNYSKTIYQHNRNKLIIICPKHGEFKQIAGSHLQGCGCPICNDSGGELNTRKFFEFMFNKSFSKIKPNWLINPKTNRKLEIDIANEKLNIYVEHSGQHHYKFNKFFHKTIEQFEYRKSTDILKRKLCKENNKNLIEIPEGLSKEKLIKYLTVMFKKYNLNPVNSIESAIDKFYA